MTRQPDKLPKPSSAEYADYVHSTVIPTLYKSMSRDKANQLIVLVQYLERQRYDFSSDRAYQTRPICIAEIAEYFGVTCRSVQRWFAALEDIGILARHYRKDPKHKFKNKFSRVDFSGFKAWFSVKLSDLVRAARDTLCRPTEKNIFDIKIKPKVSEKDFNQDPPRSFPTSGGVKYDAYWLQIAEANLPSGRSRPCTTRTAENFRKFLKSHDIPLTSKSMTKRWANWCKRANPV